MSHYGCNDLLTILSSMYSAFLLCGSEDVSKVKDEVEDMFFYLAWLDPFYKPRKTSSNFITIDSGNEGTDDDDTQSVDDKSDTTETTTSDADNRAASNCRVTKKPKLQMKKK